MFGINVAAQLFLLVVDIPHVAAMSGGDHCVRVLTQLPPSPIPAVTLQLLHWLELQLQGALIFPVSVTPFTLSISIFSCYFMFDVDIPPEFSTGSKYV